jgi:hypothetical protein
MDRAFDRRIRKLEKVVSPVKEYCGPIFYGSKEELEKKLIEAHKKHGEGTYICLPNKRKIDA